MYFFCGNSTQMTVIFFHLPLRSLQSRHALVCGIHNFLQNLQFYWTLINMILLHQISSRLSKIEHKLGHQRLNIRIIFNLTNELMWSVKIKVDVEKHKHKNNYWFSRTLLKRFNQRRGAGHSRESAHYKKWHKIGKCKVARWS